VQQFGKFGVLSCVPKQQHTFHNFPLPFTAQHTHLHHNSIERVSMHAQRSVHALLAALLLWMMIKLSLRQQVLQVTTLRVFKAPLYTVSIEAFHLDVLTE
jgi:hypothetical protein